MGETTQVVLTLDEAKALAKMREESRNSVLRPKSKSDRHMLVNRALGQQYDIVRVNSNGTYYYKIPEESVYERLTDHKLNTIVRDIYLSGGWAVDAKEIKEASDTIKMMTMNEVDDLNNDIWCVTPRIFWDTNLGKLVGKPNGYCFRKLFNTKYPDKHVVQIPEFSKRQEQKMIETYKEVLSKLNNGIFEERYEFIRTWANGDHDVYMDIMRSISYCFVKKKPVGSYILVGLRRNGKSSFVGLLHTIFGRENTSDVRLSQLGDPHYVNKLKYTMMNAPDEEDEKAIDAQASFKTIADHGLLTLSVMRSNEPIQLPCDFMCFYPMNHIPDWRGTGASACMKRSLIIPFYADLSRFDKKNYEFAKETFTANFMCEFMGTVFAYANYYSRHELEFSQTMLSEQESLEEEVDSAVTYRKEFEKYFDGFETMKLLYQDYINWCKAQDLTISQRSEFKFVFREYSAKRTTIKINNTLISGYRIPNANHSFLYADARFKEAGSLRWMHEHDISVVERLNMYYLDKRMGR